MIPLKLYESIIGLVPSIFKVIVLINEWFGSIDIPITSSHPTSVNASFRFPPSIGDLLVEIICGCLFTPWRFSSCIEVFQKNIEN